MAGLARRRREKTAIVVKTRPDALAPKREVLHRPKYMFEDDPPRARHGAPNCLQLGTSQVPGPPVHNIRENRAVKSGSIR